MYTFYIQTLTKKHTSTELSKSQTFLCLAQIFLHLILNAEFCLQNSLWILYIFVNSQQISNMIKHFLITPFCSKSGKRLSLVNRENTFNYPTQVPKLRRFVLLYPNGACGCSQSTHVRERQTQISLHVHVYIIDLVPQATKSDD